MLGIGALEYLRSLCDQFDELAAELRVSAFGVLVPSQVTAQLVTLLLELIPSLPEELFRDQPVKAIVVEPIHEELLLFDFGPDLLDDRLVVVALFLAALGDALQQPTLGVVWDGDAGQQRANLLVELLLADIGLAACFLAGAVVVDIALLLQFRGEVTAAGAADQQALICEVVFLVDGLLVGAEGRLDRVPHLARDQRRMAPGPGSSFPTKVAVVEGILEQPLELTEADEFCLFRGGQALIPQLLPQRLERVGAGRVQLKGASDHRGLDWIQDDHLSIAFAGVAVAKWRLVWKAAFLHLLGHAFLDLVGEIVDVVFGQQHHHPEGQLARRVVWKVLLPEERLCG